MTPYMIYCSLRRIRLGKSHQGTWLACNPVGQHLVVLWGRYRMEAGQ